MWEGNPDGVCRPQLDIPKAVSGSLPFPGLFVLPVPDYGYSREETETESCLWTYLFFLASIGCPGIPDS